MGLVWRTVPSCTVLTSMLRSVGCAAGDFQPPSPGLDTLPALAFPAPFPPAPINPALGKRSLEAFVPGTPFYLVGRMGWRCLLGFGGLLPGALLLGRRTRGW